MRKIFTLIIAGLISVNCFAQRGMPACGIPVNSVIENNSFPPGGIAARTTHVGDTVKLIHIADTAALFLYPAGSLDSGYVTGTDYWGDRAFAERYTFNGSDSSVQIIGVFAQFGGTVSASSGKTININVWDQGDQVTITPSEAYNGFPNNLLYSKSVPVTQLGIGHNTDTMKKYLFASPIKRYGSFFVGYSMDYSFSALNGDTLGLACTRNGSRQSPYLTTVTANITDAGDTTIMTVTNVQNATMFSDSTWHDNYTQNDSMANFMAIYPLVVINSPTGVSSITRNNFTFFGNYPNPATTSTNIKCSLVKSADVTIQVMDMDGRVIGTIKQNNLSAGEHIIPINTAQLPAGDYLYLIRTSDGDGVAGKMTVNR